MNWRTNWVIFSSPHGDSADKAWTILANEGCDISEWFIDSHRRGILHAMGLDTRNTHVFHGTTYVGTERDLDTYIYTLRRQHGEI